MVLRYDILIYYKIVRYYFTFEIIIIKYYNSFSKHSLVSIFIFKDPYYNTLT